MSDRIHDDFISGLAADIREWEAIPWWRPFKKKRKKKRIDGVITEIGADRLFEQVKSDLGFR